MRLNLNPLPTNSEGNTDFDELTSSQNFLPSEQEILDSTNTEAESEARIDEYDDIISDLENVATAISARPQRVGSFTERLVVDLLLGYAYTINAVARLLNSPLHNYVVFGAADGMGFTAITNVNGNVTDFVIGGTVAQVQSACQALIDALYLITGRVFSLTTPELQFSDGPATLNVQLSVTRQANDHTALYYFADAILVVDEEFMGSDWYDAVSSVVTEVEGYLQEFDNDIAANASAAYGFTELFN